MKRKILLGFGKMKRVYANIHNDVLLIYYTEKDSKPIGLIDLKNYTAKENTESTSRNFNLICDSPEQKPLHFIAPTREEMMQWVWQINKIHDGLIEPDLESVSSDAEYDVMKNNPCTPKKSTESDELYEELETVKDKLRVSNLNERVEIRPPLPGRIQLKKSPIKVAPPVVKSLPSQILDEPVSSSPKNSEDEDNTYEVFADLKCEIQIVHENEDESAEQGNETEDNYEVFTDLKKRIKAMKIDRSEVTVNSTENINSENSAAEEQLPQCSEKPQIATKPLVIKRFQVTLASEST
ncbi:unnamed protein product [Acanthoscelides obtectus]|nr:unnamed protein product [Acanthoscelides obtectus]CAK1628821.1 hypothetical protein AOBTE_LOCUS5418 [Acanthoscelides obtectus]